MDNDGLAGRRQPILLLPEGQQVLSIIELKLELPPYTNSEINEMLHGDGTAGVGREEFLATARKSIVACLFGRDDSNRIITDEQRGLTTTIVDKEEWPKEEKRIETALRLFPDILLEQFLGYSLIQWLAMAIRPDVTYNLKNVSLLPLVIKLSIELQGDNELRGGLLSLYPCGTWNVLQQITCYHNTNNENNERCDACFSVVRNLMRENNYLVNEDIQRYNLVGQMSTDTVFVSESRLRYLINMDPVTLSLPCWPEQGNSLPFHWSTKQDFQVFSFVLAAGIKYYPEKLGFAFGEGTHRNSGTGTLCQGTPYQHACKKYGQEKVLHEVINCIKEYCSSISSTSAVNNNNNTATSLLMSAITDESIHVDGVYVLFRDDPEAALLRLQEAARAVVVVREEIITDTDFNIDINNENSNSASASASASASNNNTADALSSDSTTDTVVAASVIVVGSSATTNNSNNNVDNRNDDDNGNGNGNTTQHKPSKKRKHERV